MPIVLPAMTATLTGSLSSVSLIGQSVPQLALGVAGGLQYWVPTIQIQTVDTGSLGAGTGVPQPLIVPQPALMGALQTTLSAAGLVGIMTPTLSLGLSNGLSQAFLAMILFTNHPGIGTGAGVAKFVSPSAVDSMLKGFASATLLGEAAPRLATAIGVALDTVFASLVIPISIVGSASPTGGSGTGLGKII